MELFCVLTLNSILIGTIYKLHIIVGGVPNKACFTVGKKFIHSYEGKPSLAFTIHYYSV